jgi:hypothetical protein
MFNKKQQILYRLIVTRLVLGIQPSSRLLEKYSLMQFAPLLASYKNGNFRQFYQDVQQIAEQLIQAQVYTIMMKWTRVNMVSSTMLMI